MTTLPSQRSMILRASNGREAGFPPWHRRLSRKNGDSEKTRPDTANLPFKAAFLGEAALSSGDLQDTLEWQIFLILCFAIAATAVRRSRTSGEWSMAFSGFCAPVRPGVTCPSDTAIGTQSLCASHAGARSACGTRHSKSCALGCQETRSMPSTITGGASTPLMTALQ